MQSSSSEGIAEAGEVAEPTYRSAARDAWALLLGRIHEPFPLLCPHCGSEMRLIAFITGAGAVND
jgi:hypothetical protein